MLDLIRSWTHDLDEPSGNTFAIDLLEWRGDDLRVVLLHTGSHGNELDQKRWEILCRGAHDVQIRERQGDLEVLDAASPVLRQFNEPWRDLTFNGTTSEPESLAWRLSEAHRAVADGWIELETYLNPLMPLRELLAGRYGLLADGPEFIVQALAPVLQAAGIKSTLGPPRPARYWHDGSWHDRQTPLVGMMIGRSTIVAASFEDAPGAGGS